MQTAGVLEAFSNGEVQAPWSLVKDCLFDVNTKLVVASGSMVVMETFPDWDKVVIGFYPDTEGEMISFPRLFFFFFFLIMKGKNKKAEKSCDRKVPLAQKW